jgi:hypothetical protein
VHTYLKKLTQFSSYYAISKEPISQIVYGNNGEGDEEKVRRHLRRMSISLHLIENNSKCLKSYRMKGLASSEYGIALYHQR